MILAADLVGDRKSGTWTFPRGRSHGLSLLAGAFWQTFA